MWTVKSANLPPARFPAQNQRVGNTSLDWFECEPGIAHITTEGGSVDDRWLFYATLRDELATLGIRIAQYSFDNELQEQPEPKNAKEANLIKDSAWPDIMAKAKRLIQSGNVTLLRNGYNVVVAHVIGDHGQYQCEISRDDPASRSITQWTCECPWDQYAFQRTRQWKKYEARPCAHVLAAYWKSLATPLDEDVAPGQENRNPGMPTPPSGAPITQGQPGIETPQQGIEQGYQPSLPMQGQDPNAPPMPMPGQDETYEGPILPQMPGVPNPSQVPATPPAALTQPLMAPPGESGIIPPQPAQMEMMPPPVSVPGGRIGPYPANPLQQPGTFSSVAPGEYNYETNRWEEDPDYVYHAAPTQERSRILQHGLQPSYPNGIKPGATAEGVYVTSHPGIEWARGRANDTWRIPRTQIKEMHPDPLINRDGTSSTFYIPHAVQPELYKPWWPETLAAIYKVAGANDQFIQGMKARLNETTLGQSEGREGAYDAGQWMEVPKNSMVEVRDQDKTTGWVEIIYPLKGGPMSSYHVRCFVEPEKLSPMGGYSPFQNPKGVSSAVTPSIQVHDAPSPYHPSVSWDGANGPVASTAMIWDNLTNTLHVGAHDDVHHADMWPELAVDNTGLVDGYPGYISHTNKAFQWYDTPPDPKMALHALTQHLGYVPQDMDALNEGVTPQDVWE